MRYSRLVVAAMTLVAAVQAQGQVFAPGDTVFGGQSDGTNFNVGMGGFLGDVNNWPFAEPPDSAIDGLGDKYLNFGKTNTGLIVTPSSGSSIAKNMTIWTANDSVERDPASYELYGTNTGISGSGPFPLSSFTLISSGALDLPDSRNPGDGAALDNANSQSIPFLNSESYASYLVVFPTIKDPDTANSMQVAEVQLNVGPPTLTLQVNTLNGNVTFRNDADANVDIRSYQIESPMASLSLAGWNSLEDNPLFPAASSPGAGDGWEEGGGSSSSRITEAYLRGTSTITMGQPPVSLGAIFDTSVGIPDVQFKITGADGNPILGLVEYTDEPGDLTCDFNTDTLCDIDDLDLLYAELGGSNPQFDLDGDGTVGPGDITEWLTQASAADPQGRTFKPGDTDLDGAVGGSDFTTLAFNFGQAPTTWGQGNFDGSSDGVGGPDFTALAFNFGFTSVNAVPEPAGLLPAFLAFAIFIVRPRR